MLYCRLTLKLIQYIYEQPTGKLPAETTNVFVMCVLVLLSQTL